MATGRPSLARTNFMYLDGNEAGFLKSVDGGGVTGEVVTESVGSSFYVKKHIGNAKYEEFNLKFSFSMSKPVYDWIAAACKGDYTRRNGAIIACDFDYVARSEREFSKALITEVTIPAMDGSSKEAAYLTIRVKPESVRYKKGSGQKIGGTAKPKQKLWLPSNFRLEIPDLDCKRVTKIDSFSIKQKFASSQIGEGRDHEVQPGKLEFPNLSITLPEANAQSWIDWHNEFVIMGKNTEADEKSGSLTFLAPDISEELGRINFYNLGIFRLDFNAAESDEIQTVTAGLYCERMEFQPGK